jgi:hypothetical protein
MTTATTTKTEKKVLTPVENKKGIENHKKIATHLEAAAKEHLEAAKNHESGNHDKAAQSTIAAHGHFNLAKEAQIEDVKHHATIN